AGGRQGAGGAWGMQAPDGSDRAVPVAGAPTGRRPWGPPGFRSVVGARRGGERRRTVVADTLAGTPVAHGTAACNGSRHRACGPASARAAGYDGGRSAAGNGGGPRAPAPAARPHSSPVAGPARSP